MIYTTGDTHIPIDVSKLNTTNFLQQKTMTKNDYVIICGDFGGVWDGSKSDQYWLKWFKERNFTTLFVDGNHENFDLLSKYPVQEWNGGLVHKINDSVIHLMRGQVYLINGLKIFTMGGATSVDKWRRTEGVSWWKEEIPSQEEFNAAMDNLDKHNWDVDIVITHTTSLKRMDSMGYKKENNPLNKFFDLLEENLKYKHWYFGHFHEDIYFDEKHTAIYNKIIQIVKEP